MEDVRFYDFEFSLVHIEHDIISSNWTLLENGVGTFEIHLPLTSDLVPIAMEQRYLVAVQGDKQAIITGRRLGTEAVFYGRSCNWILSRFCIAETFDTDALYEAGALTAKDAKTVCAYLLSKGMSHVENFVFEEKERAEYEDVFLENKGITSLLELVIDVLQQGRGGHDVFFDVKNKLWRFRLFKGKNLPLVLSEANRNCYDTVYTTDLQNHYSGGWYEQAVDVAGDWDAGENEPFLRNDIAENFAKAYRVSADGSRFGIDFIAGNYIICRTADGQWTQDTEASSFLVRLPSDKTGIYAWETPLFADNGQAAQKELAACKEEKQTDVTTKGLVFGKDYGLGDRVLMQIKKGGFASGIIRQVTGVHLWYERDGVGEQPILADVEV